MAHIILVDDDKDLVEMNTTVLTRRGHTVTVAYSAAQAREAGWSTWRGGGTESINPFRRYVMENLEGVRCGTAYYVNAVPRDKSRAGGCTQSGMCANSDRLNRGVHHTRLCQKLCQ